MADDDFWSDIGEVAAEIVAIYAVNAVQSALAGKKGAGGVETTDNQSVPFVTNLVGGWSQIYGAYVFREIKGGDYVAIYATSDGRWELSDVYLDDNIVHRDGLGVVDHVYAADGTEFTDGRYVETGHGVTIDWREGLPTETAYAAPISIFAGTNVNYDSSYRGDGTGSVMIQFNAPKSDKFTRVFPKNINVTPSFIGRGMVYDWRKDSTAIIGYSDGDPLYGSGSHRRDDDTTWEPSANPLVWGVALDAWKLNRDWDEDIAPKLPALTIHANYCDTAFPKKAGGTQPLYRVAFNYTDDESVDSIRQAIMDSMDGWYSEDQYGRIELKCGMYEEPAFTIEDGDILEWTWRSGVPNADTVSQINITVTSPENMFQTGQTDPWPIGDGAKPDDFNLRGVDNVPQGRYLAKRRANKLMPTYQGSVTVGRMGRFGKNQRIIRVRNSRQASMSDVVCVVTNLSWQDASSADDERYTFSIYAYDPAIEPENWNPDTEEGNPIDTVGSAGAEALAQPVIDTVTPFYDGSNVRLSIIGDYPLRSDLTPVSSWRVPGGLWNDTTNTDFVDNGGGSFTTNTGVVISAASLETRIAYITGGGTLSPWSTTETVNSSVVPPSWADPGAVWQAELTSASNRFWDGNAEYASLAAAITAGKATYSRASAVWARNAAAAYTSIASGVVAMTDYGALIEPSATNSALYSDTMSNAAWVAGNGTKTAGQTTPFGSDGALYTGNGASGLHYLRQAGMSIIDGSSYTITARVKAGTTDRVQLALDQGFITSQYSNFYLSGAGSVSATGAGASNSIRLENGWYILTHTATASANSANGTAYVMPLVSGSETRLLNTITTAGTFTVGHLGFGPTAEGSPISTTSAAVTRAATALLFKPVPGTYDIALTMGDSTTTTLSAVAITGSGWTVPSALSRYVKKIVATA